MELQFVIKGIYSFHSFIGLIEGLIYELNFRERVYYPKNKELINKKNIEKTLNIKFEDEDVIEEFV